MPPPQDPNLYGQRAPKRQKKAAALPSSLAFTSELASLISSSKSSSSALPLAAATAAASSFSSSSTTQAARARPSKSKNDIFAGVKAKRKAESAASSIDQHGHHHDQTHKRNRDRAQGRLILKEPHGTQDAANELAAARRKMEEKARLYASMKRGDYVPKEGEAASLVDFDRKWAETQDHQSASSSSDNDDDDDESDNNDTETITYTDEFGRTRTGTRAERARMERRLRASEYTTTELERMSARPKAPPTLIHGDAIQAEAFVARDLEQMEAIARKRDRSLTPPEMKHYDANAEIRTKGVGFFQFSKDGETRAKEMAQLAKERETTEQERLKRDEERDERRKEVAERRRLIEKRRKEKGAERAQKLADDFLDGLAGEMGKS